MSLKRHLISIFAITLCSLPLSATATMTTIQPKHFSKIMVVIFENMSYAEIKDEPTFRRLVEYTGNTLDGRGRLIRLPKSAPLKDREGNGYAFFSQYYNNHNGGTTPTRTSQPNYIAMTSGSPQGIDNNDVHDLNVDNLGMEMIEAGISWKVYADDLPDPILPLPPFKAMQPYQVDPNKDEQQNEDVEKQYRETYLRAKEDYEKEYTRRGFYPATGCFYGASYAENKDKEDGYKRKHEPFISYTNLQGSYCKNMVNSSHIFSDINDMPQVSFYIPNQINDGHNGSLSERVKNANAFLSTMMGTNPNTGEPLPNSQNAPFQQFMARGGLLVITFDEPSVTGNPDNTVYTLLAGNMINSDAYPNQAGQHSPLCFPSAATLEDTEGSYPEGHCNHYNLLKMIEDNFSLRGLYASHTTSGYKTAYPLDHHIEGILWK